MYKDIIFGNDSRICEGCLNELGEQGNIDECLYQERLKQQRVRSIRRTLANMVETYEVPIDGRTDEIIGSIVDNKYCREKF